jgi:hypothetical protein
MRRYFLIETLDGIKYPLSFEKVFSDQFGKPTFVPQAAINNPNLVAAAVALCQEGFCPTIKDDLRNATVLEWIAPSQIKSVKIIFEDDKEEKKSNIITLDQ